MRWWPVLVWTGLIFAASSIPGSKFGDVGFEFSDKIVHGVEYGVLGFLVFLAARPEISPAGLSAFAVALVWVMLTGLVDENYQRLIPLRDSSLADWWADVLGGAIGAAVAWRTGYKGPWTRRRDR